LSERESVRKQSAGKSPANTNRRNPDTCDWRKRIRRDQAQGSGGAYASARHYTSPRHVPRGPYASSSREPNLGLQAYSHVGLINSALSLCRDVGPVVPRRRASRRPRRRS